MSAKKNSMSEKAEKRGRVNLGKLQGNLETPTDLTVSELRKVKGGTLPIEAYVNSLMGSIGKESTEDLRNLKK